LVSGCSKNIGDFNFKDIKVPSVNIPLFSKYKIDNTLPLVQNLRYRSSMREIVLEWDHINSNQIAGFRILRYNPANKSYTVIGTIRDSDATHYVDSSLKFNSTYRYRISTFTKDGRLSRASKPIDAVTQYKLVKISELKAQSNLPRKVKLTWKLYPYADKINYYSIQRSTNGSTNWQEIARLNKKLSVEYIDHTVKDYKLYYYRVLGYSYDRVPTPSSDIVSAHSKTLPKPPVNITATQNQPRKIKIAWFDTNENNQIVQYNIYTSVFKDTLFIKHASTPNMFYIDDVNADGKVVYYKITAVDKDGLESPMPKEATKAMSKANSSAPKITEYKLVDNRVIIKWAPPARDVREYIVIKKYTTDYFLPKTLKITGFTNRMFVDKDIKLGKTYKYQIIGIDKDKVLTKPSNQIAITVR